MTDLAINLVLVFVGFSLASGLAIYAYGRVARRPLGSPSMALPHEADRTALDRIIAPLV